MAGMKPFELPVEGRNGYKSEGRLAIVHLSVAKSWKVLVRTGRVADTRIVPTCIPPLHPVSDHILY